SGIRVVEATQQLQQGALARPIRPNNGSDRACGDCEFEAIESKTLCCWITERDVSKADLDPCLARNGARRERIGNFRPERKEFKQAAEEEAAGVNLAYVGEKCVHQAEALLKSLVEHRQVT